jgi:Na+/proline symporter
MHWIDYVLIIAFALCFLFIGIRQNTKLLNLRAFSLYNREFSTSALAFTIFATWVRGSGFFIDLQRFYNKGYEYLIPSLGMIISVGFVCMKILPKAHTILGELTVASFMGKAFNSKVRRLTAITSVIGVSGGIAIQFQILGVIGNTIFSEIPVGWCACFGGLVIGLYSYNGGIKNVVYTDKIQGLCFILSFCLIGYNLIITNQGAIIPNDLDIKFHPTKIFNKLSYADMLSMFFLFIYFALPGISATEFQRISMATSIYQLKKSWYISSIGFILSIFLVCFFGYLVHQQAPNLSQDDIFVKLLSNITFPTGKAILFLGVISMCMSTADSHINISAVILANDLVLNKNIDGYTRLRVAKYCVILITIMSLLLLWKQDDLLSIIMFSNSFYMPIITISLLGVIFNKKTTSRCMLFSAGVTFAVVIYCHLCDTLFDAFACGLIVNLLILITTHHIIEKWNLLARFGFPSQLKK